MIEAIIQRELSVQLPIFAKLTIPTEYVSQNTKIPANGRQKFPSFTNDPKRKPPKGERMRAIAGLIIGLGIVLRVIPYLHNRSLWLDEAMLAKSILLKPFS